MPCPFSFVVSEYLRWVTSPRRLIGVALCLLAAFIDVGAALKHYNTKAGPVPNKLNVHLVAHT